MKININNGIISYGKGEWLPEDGRGIEKQLFEVKYIPFKSDRGPIDAEREDFMWETHKGKRIKPREMATPHLFNTIKMLWNNTVPPVFRVGPFKRYRDVGTWDLKYLMRALDELQDEFESRDDIESEDRDLFNDMLLNSDVLKQL